MYRLDQRVGFDDIINGIIEEIIIVILGMEHFSGGGGIGGLGVQIAGLLDAFAGQAEADLYRIARLQVMEKILHRLFPLQVPVGKDQDIGLFFHNNTVF